MNPLLALMHDTAHSIFAIDNFALLIEKRLKSLNIQDPELNEYVAIIRKSRDELIASLDSYYLTTKKNEK